MKAEFPTSLPLKYCAGLILVSNLGPGQCSNVNWPQAVDLKKNYLRPVFIF